MGKHTRKVRNITVCVTPELYRQTRLLAVEYDTTVTAMVAGILQVLPGLLKRIRYPVGGPKAAPQAAAPASAGAPASSAAQSLAPALNPLAPASVSPVQRPAASAPQCPTT